jgi:hypothetical protein
MTLVFLDKVSANNHIASVVASEELQNGQFLHLGVAGKDGESRVATKATGAADAQVLLANPLLDYGYADYDPSKETLKAGKVGRAYRIAEPGMTISVTADLAPKIVAGDRVTVGAGGLGFAKAAEGDDGIGLAIADNEYHGEYDGPVTVIVFE